MSEPEPTVPAIDVGERAGAVTRLAAFLVDAVVLAITLRTTGWLLRAIPHLIGRFAPPVNLHGILLALVPLIAAGYVVGFWTVIGQTPGKWLLGVRVVPASGGDMTFRRSLVRLVGYLLSALPLYLGFLWMLGPARRGWHDLMAGTEVRYVRRTHGVPTDATVAAVRGRMRTPVTRPAAYHAAGRAAKADAPS
jgi:uncharacterized RDD family membrane protein YckC